ncbi:MAG: porin family protein [Sulfuricella sp.]|jgi:tetratricopeptide (TPR) repeat protein
MKYSIFHRIGKLIIGITLYSASHAMAAPPDMIKAQSLMAAGRAGDAYALLAPAEFEMAGKVDYDYLLGTAALDSGRPDKATLAFERVLAVNPSHYGARLDLARAYYALGDHERAGTEFGQIMKQNPPVLARTIIEQYLAAIENHLNPQTRFTGYVEAAFGHDTNVNVASSNSTMYIPIFGASFSLVSSNQATQDNYMSFGGGGEVTIPVRQGLSLFAGLEGKKRENFEQNGYNTSSIDGRIGMNIGADKNVLRLALQKGGFYLDDHYNRDTTGLTGEWRHIPDPRNQFSIFGQYAQLRYDRDKLGNDLSSNDVDQTIIGGGWLHALDEGGSSVLFGSLYAGSEHAVEQIQRIDGDQDFAGFRAGGQTRLNDSSSVFASAGYKYGSYSRRNLLFLDYRRDHQYDLNIGLNWVPVRNWTVRPQISYTRNESTIAMNDYDRTDISATVRHDFK